MNFFKLFLRPTTGRFIAVIDGLRFFAIMPVLFLHASTAFLDYSSAYDSKVVGKSEWLRKVFLSGEAGVYIFFVISGFILALPFAKHHLFEAKKVSLGKYMRRRIIRLEPPYLLTLTAFFFLHLWVLKEQSFSELFPHFMASVFYIHNIVYGHWSTINPVAWSLEIEIQFYILMPLLTQVFVMNKKYRRLLLLALMILSPLIHELPLREWHLNRSMLSHYQFFLAGILAADLYLTKDYQLSKHLNTSLIFIFLPLIFLLMYQRGNYMFTLPFVILIFVLAALHDSYFKAVFENRLIVIIGGACYITYLIHYPLLHLLSKMTSNLSLGQNFSFDILVHMAIVIPITLIISLAAFLLVEKPFMLMSQGKLQDIGHPFREAVRVFLRRV